jgi:hypothetical protein
MDVIGHQHVGMDVAAISIGELVQEAEIDTVVPVPGEAWKPVVASLDDMERQPGDSQASLSRHGKTLRSMPS